MKLSWSRFCLDFKAKTCIMGILNVTPDSFSDGGQHFNPTAALDRALRMIDEGADIIDIGGESTRPGSIAVEPGEELRRCIPVIEQLARVASVPISIDTCKAIVAEKALEAGAAMVNDISGMMFDPEMAAVASRFRVPVVLMHIKGRPRDMQLNPQYEDLIPEILEHLVNCMDLAKKAGVAEDMIILDPGIGFGKTFEHNLAIINNLHEFSRFGRPVLIGPSRKAFIGKILGGAPAGERIEGTAAAVAVSVIKGANIVRVHDVKEMAKVVKVADAIKRERIL